MQGPGLQCLRHRSSRDAGLVYFHADLGHQPLQGDGDFYLGALGYLLGTHGAAGGHGQGGHLGVRRHLVAELSHVKAGFRAGDLAEDIAHIAHGVESVVPSRRHPPFYGFALGVLTQVQVLVAEVAVFAGHEHKGVVQAVFNIGRKDALGAVFPFQGKVHHAFLFCRT